MNQMWLACVSGCPGRHDPFQPLFSCPSCGGLIDVEVDVSSLPRQPTRRRSGTWAFHSWIAPGLQEEEIVSLGEGAAPIVDVEIGGARAMLQQCGQQPTGSFKDLGMTVLVSMALAMRRRGRDVRALVCASTGDTSAALAAYGARAGIPVVVLLPKNKVSPAQLVQPLAAGARVLELDGDFDAAMRVVAQLASLPGVFLANSKNPLRLQGQMTVAFEIAFDLAAGTGGDVPDFVLVPSGNLGNIAAIHRGFSLLQQLGVTRRVPRLVACQVDAANPLYRAWQANFSAATTMAAGETHATAIRIGDPVSLPRAKKALLASDGLVTSVAEAALLDAMGHADRQGLFVCPHTATALAGLAQLSAAGVIKPEHKAVVVSTASGLKFVEQKAVFHGGSTALGNMELPAHTAALRNPPRCVPATLDAVARELGAIL